MLLCFLLAERAVFVLNLASFDELFLTNLQHLLCIFDNRWLVPIVTIIGIQCTDYFGCGSDLSAEMVDYAAKLW